MSDLNNLPKLVVPDDIRYAKPPTVSDLQKYEYDGLTLKGFTIKAPEAVIDFIRDQLRASDAVAHMEGKTEFVLEVLVSPLASAKKLRILVMAYIFQIYQLQGLIKEYQKENLNETIVNLFTIPGKLANLVADMFEEMNKPEETSQPEETNQPEETSKN